MKVWTASNSDKISHGLSKSKHNVPADPGQQGHLIKSNCHGLELRDTGLPRNVLASSVFVRDTLSKGGHAVLARIMGRFG